MMELSLYIFVIQMYCITEFPKNPCEPIKIRNEKICEDYLKVLTRPSSETKEPK